MNKLLKNLKLLLLTFFIISFFSGCYLLITKNLIVFAESDRISSQDEKILSYYHEPTIDENFEDNKVNIILKSSYDDLCEIGFDEFKVVEQVAEINYIKYNLRQYTDEETDTINLSKEKNHMFTLELAVNDKQTVLNAISLLQKLNMILVAEPSYIYDVEYFASSIAMFYEYQWGLNGTYGINIEQAWDITTGNNNVKVGVMEVGMDLTHGDLSGRVFNGNNSTTASDEDIAHGTHVAGIIGAYRNSGEIAGIADVSMYLLDPGAFVDSLKYASDNNIKVINASFGFAYKDNNDKVIYLPYNSSHYNALANYNGLFVAAAGNESNNNDNLSVYPACYNLPNVISVGAIDMAGNRLNDSNYGKTTVDIFAPGEWIISTYPEYICDKTCKEGYDLPHCDNGYHIMSGTSMAAPHVTGVAALLLSIDNTLTGAELKQIICDNVDKDSRLTQYCVSGGRLNAYKAVSLPSVISFSNDGLINRFYNMDVTYGSALPEVSFFAPVKEGYAFDGYYDSNGKKYYEMRVADDKQTADMNMLDHAYIEKVYPVSGVKWDHTKDTTLYARWTLLECDYTIVNKCNQNTISSSVVHLKTGKNTLSPASISGYNFSYYMLDLEKAGSNVLDLVLYRSYSNVIKPKTVITAIYEAVSSGDSGKCLAEGTMITLADGSQKAVELLTGSEQLLVWNLYTGSFDFAPILFIDFDEAQNYTVINLNFSDGTSVDVISEHAFWDINLNKYVTLSYDAEQYVGHWFNKQITNADGTVDWIAVQLSGVEIKTEYTSAWSPVTYGHLCYYVNGMLSMPGGIEGLYNIFEVDAETMKFDEAAFEADIATYGLFTYEEFCELYNTPELMFEACGGQYLKVAMGKGLLDSDSLAGMIERYSTFFQN